jgi:hypothetical protein
MRQSRRSIIVGVNLNTVVEDDERWFNLMFDRAWRQENQSLTAEQILAEFNESHRTVEGGPHHPA